MTEEIEGEKEEHLATLKALSHDPSALQTHLYNQQRLCTPHHACDRSLALLARGKAGGNDSQMETNGARFGDSDHLK